MVTYQDVRQDHAVTTYIRRADETLGALGFTEHSFAHVTAVFCSHDETSLFHIHYITVFHI